MEIVVRFLRGGGPRGERIGRTKAQRWKCPDVLRNSKEANESGE